MKNQYECQYIVVIVSNKNFFLKITEGKKLPNYAGLYVIILLVKRL